MNNEIKEAINEIKKHNARYQTRDGISAVISASDANSYIKVVIRNYYGYQISEVHFSYFSGNPVENAKSFLDNRYPDMFRIR